MSYPHQAESPSNSPRRGRSRFRSTSRWQGPWGERFLLAAVIAIPFQQALTLNVGFPLKASEVFAALGIVLCLFERTWPRLKTVGVRLVLALAGITLVSSAWNLFAEPVSTASAAYPHGLGLDLAQYTAYALFALVSASFLTAIDRYRLLSALGWAVRIAAAYTILQLLMWGIGTDVLASINGNVQLGTQYGISLPRNGPMREGNYLGFFAAASFFLLVRGRDFIGVLLALFLVLFTQSTGAMAGIIAGLLLGIILCPSLRKIILGAAIAVVATVTILFVPAAKRLLLGQLTKLGLIENNFGAAYTYSLRHRSAQADTAFAMAADHPLVGVGQGRFAHHFEDYLDRTNLPSNYASGWNRPIANNVYAQLAAETGIIALGLLAILLVYVVFRARQQSSALVGAVGAIAVGLIAFPAWTNLFLWTLVGIVLNLVSAQSHTPDESRTRRSERESRRALRWGYYALPKFTVGREE